MLIQLRKRFGKDNFQIFSTLLALFLLAGFFAFGSPFFLTVDNLNTVALQISPIVLIAIGQTFVLISASIDLSVAPMMALAGVVAAKLMTSLSLVIPSVTLVFVVSLVAALLVAAAVGLLNGSIIVYAKLPPFIVTMGMMSILRGSALLITSGRPVTFNSLLNNSDLLPELSARLVLLRDSFALIGSGRLLAIPLPVFLMIFLALLMSFLLAKTQFGVHLYATGSNINVARLSGVKTKKIIISAYVISSLLAASAGLIATSRILAAGPNDFIGYEIFSVAAAVIGGTSLAGGQGMVWGTVIGSFVIGVLQNGLNLMRVSSYTQQVFIGAIIILSVLLDRLRQRR